MFHSPSFGIIRLIIFEIVLITTTVRNDRRNLVRNANRRCANTKATSNQCTANPRRKNGREVELRNKGQYSKPSEQEDYQLLRGDLPTVPPLCVYRLRIGHQLCRCASCMMREIVSMWRKNMRHNPTYMLEKSKTIACRTGFESLISWSAIAP